MQANKYIPRAMQAIRAVDVSGIQKLKPVKKRQRDIRGKVVSSKFLRPLGSQMLVKQIRL